MMRFISILVAFSAFLQAAAQNTTTFLSGPEELWTANAAPMDRGNECALPDIFNPLLICTGANGFATALNLKDGTEAWRFEPGVSLTSSSGVTFSSGTTDSSFVYATQAGSGGSYSCQVHSLSTRGGVEIWVSQSLTGNCSGTPILSGDNAYAFVTHNLQKTGTFTVLNATDGSILFNFTDKSSNLSPPGIYFNPMQGNYGSGVGNSNDLIVFANRPAPASDEVPTANSVYAFQFPIGFPTSSEKFSVVTLFNETDFQSTTPPLITNGGESMFMGVSRSKVVGWANTNFDRDPGGNSIGFDRGDPRSLPILAELAIGSETATPTIYTGNAGPNFAAINTVSDPLNLKWAYNTTRPVYTKAIVAPRDIDRVVFFIEELGVVYAINASSGKLLWQDAIGANVYSSFAMNAESNTMYFGDINGVIRAWQVAKLPPPTAPTEAPVAPSMAPTSMSSSPQEAPTSTPAPIPSPPTSSATEKPIPQETAAPTAEDTVPQSSAPTSASTTKAPASGASLLGGMQFGIAAAASFIIEYLLM